MGEQASDTPVPNYWDYLRLDRLLSIQGGLEDDETRLIPDEVHFIVVHQVFELWFKLILRELRLARDHLAAPRVPEEHVPFVVHHLRRVNEILRLQVDQFRVMETLTPQDFLSFRDKLTPASGFQSFQMREIEILLGMDASRRVPFGTIDPVEFILKTSADTAAGRMATERLRAAQQERDLRSALNAWLYRTPIQGSTPGDPRDEAILDRFRDQYLGAYRRLLERQTGLLAQRLATDAAAIEESQAVTLQEARAFLHAEDAPEPERARARRARAGLLFIESYRELPLLAWPRVLVDTVVELEELLVLWRTRHARMVERTIGRRMGTGGSAGVDYLDSTTRTRIFNELWTVRTLLLPREDLPALEHAAAYGFAQ